MIVILFNVISDKMITMQFDENENMQSEEMKPAKIQTNIQLCDLVIFYFFQKVEIIYILKLSKTSHMFNIFCLIFNEVSSRKSKRACLQMSRVI